MSLLFCGIFAQSVVISSELPSSLLQEAAKPVSTNSANLDFLSFSSEKTSAGTAVKSIPKGASEFEVELPDNKKGKVIFAKDFGLSESSEDCSFAINRALEHCRKTGASKLVLGKGTFRFFGPHGIVMDGLNNFTLDGQGAKLVFRRKSDFSKLPQFAIVEDNANMLIKKCTRVKIGNFKMDWDWETDPLGAFVKVIDKHVDKEGGVSTFDVELINYKKYPLYPKSVPILVMTRMSDALDGFSVGQSMFFGTSEGHYGTKSEWLSPNKLRIYPSVKPEGVPFNDTYDYLYGAKKNLTEVEYFAVVGKTYRIMHYYYGKNGINMESNENLTLEDVDIYSCRGMGIHVDGRQKYWQVRNVNVVPLSDLTIKRPCTTTADVYHFARSCGYTKLIDCEFSLNQDDIINFHDRTTYVKKISERKVEVVNVRKMYYFRAEPQDTLEFFKGNLAPLGFSARIHSIEGEVMEFDKPVPGKDGETFIVADRSYVTANILIKDCRFKNYYGRIILIGSNTTIENCSFENGNSIPIRVCTVCTLNKWSEGCGCSNIVIRNCRFDNNNFRLSAREGFISNLYCGASVDPATGFSKVYKGAVSDILIENNTFNNLRGIALHVGSGENILFRNNVVQRKADVEGAKSYAGSVYIKNAADVSILNNRFQLDDMPDAGIILDDCDTTTLSVSGNIVH